MRPRSSRYLPLSAPPPLEVAAEPVEEGDDDGIAGLNAGHQVLPARGGSWCGRTLSYFT